MTADELNKYVALRAKGKFTIIPFIYGYNEDGESIFTIYDTYIRSFRSAKNTKKCQGFTEYMTNLKYDWLYKYPNFSIVAFLKVGNEFLPCCEMGVTSSINNPQ